MQIILALVAQVMHTSPIKQTLPEDKLRKMNMMHAQHQHNANTGTTRFALLFASLFGFADTTRASALLDRSSSTLLLDLTSGDTRTSIIRGGSAPS